MQNYLNYLQDILDNGSNHGNDRTGHGRRRVFGRQLRFDLSNGQIPIVTTRAIRPEVFIHEILFFIMGNINIKYLNDNKVNIWNAWAVSEKSVDSFLQKLVNANKITPEQAADHQANFSQDSYGDIGPMYGWLWRHWPIAQTEINTESMIRKIDDLPSDFVRNVTKAWENLPEDKQMQTPLEAWLIGHYYSAVDQLNELVLNLKSDPYGSRHVVTAFNPEYTPIPGYSPDENVLLGKGSLMPCHFAFQVFVNPPKVEGGKKQLSLQWSQRSIDSPVGLVFNIAGYALLAHLLAHCLDMDADELVFSGGDCHIYYDQIEDVKLQLSRTPYAAPTIKLNPEVKDLFAITASDIEIINYQSHPEIKYKVAV